MSSDSERMSFNQHKNFNDSSFLTVIGISGLGIITFILMKGEFRTSRFFPKSNREKIYELR
jgi:hypothetical protein